MSKIRHLNKTEQSITDMLQNVLDLQIKGNLESVYIIYKAKDEDFENVNYGFHDPYRLIGLIEKCKLILLARLHDV